MFHDTEAFVFHTQLHHVTDLFRYRSLSKMRQKLEAKNNLWLGGTCIADSLATFNRDYAWMLNGQTKVILISDGFDTNDPAIKTMLLRLPCARMSIVLPQPTAWIRYA